MSDVQSILQREADLRQWFVRNCDPIEAQIDGLDIGWGGVERWITAQLPLEPSGRHLDFACGYATFIAQLGWRFPGLRIVGLNIDFEGPHALAEELVAQAGVADRCEFVCADAQDMPFDDEAFDSASCFLGLQDIEIGFGARGIQAALGEAVRVLKLGGLLAIADEFAPSRMRDLFEPLRLEGLQITERALDTRWNRVVAERAIELYADGWRDQVRSGDAQEREQVRADALTRMREDLGRQLAGQGTYVPFGPIRLAVARKVCR